MKSEPKMVLDMDDIKVKRNLMAKISVMTGLVEVSIKPRKLTRSLSQNSYWWAAVVQPFSEWLSQEWGESIELEQAHEILKQKILGTDELTNKKTGEVIEITRSSRVLDTAEFGEMIDKAALWLAEFCGIVVLPPEVFEDKSDQKSNVLKYQKPPLRPQLEDSLKVVEARK
jgi:hypothetical protein